MTTTTNPRPPLLAWHFCNVTLRDGRPIPPDGEVLTHTGRLEPCASGLHASERLIDALAYAPGSLLCRVELNGNRLPHEDDKWVAEQRTIFWRIDATEVLRAFARRCALDVIHQWNAPAVVREYLETGNEELRNAAAHYAAKAAYNAANVTYAAHCAANAAANATYAAYYAAYYAVYNAAAYNAANAAANATYATHYAANAAYYAAANAAAANAAYNAAANAAYRKEQGEVLTILANQEAVRLGFTLPVEPAP